MEELKQACYEEIVKLDVDNSTIKDTSIEKIVNFSYNDMCDGIDQLCPVLSTALKGSLGTTDHEDKAKAIRVGIYASIFKKR